MEILIALHVLAAILFLGPITVAVSSFQTKAVRAAEGESTAYGAAETLASITKNYGLLSLIVPVIGLTIFLTDMATYGKMGQFHASILLSVIAWALLFFLIIPKQQKALDALRAQATDAPASTKAVDTADFDWAKTKSQLSMFGGIFSLLWVIIAVLMFI